jgi:MerR family redox-sensitive transcriptional activator SoxR
MKFLSIGEVAQRSGLNTSAIRYYERLGLIPRAERVSGQRRFDPAILQRLAFIQTAQKAGFTLSQIRQLVQGLEDAGPILAGWQSLARQKLEELDAIIEQAQAAKKLLLAGMACECRTLDECALIAA